MSLMLMQELQSNETLQIPLEGTSYLFEVFFIDHDSGVAASLRSEVKDVKVGLMLQKLTCFACIH